MKNRFQDKAIIVTGGASGIAQVACGIFAREGGKVMIADINIDGANKVADQLKKEGGEAVAMKVDITSLDEANKLAQATIARYGKIDILANIVGGAIPDKVGPFAQSSPEVWRRMFEINLFSAFNCCRAVVNHMIERKSGKIVNVGSVAGIIGQANTADYAATKGGIIAFTKTLAKELAQYGINVNCVSPGTVGTPRVLKFPEESIKRILRGIYLGRLGKPEELAAAIVFLASDEASFCVGSNFIVDGGMSLGY